MAAPSVRRRQIAAVVMLVVQALLIALFPVGSHQELARVFAMLVPSTSGRQGGLVGVGRNAASAAPHKTVGIQELVGLRALLAGSFCLAAAVVSTARRHTTAIREFCAVPRAVSVEEQSVLRAINHNSSNSSKDKKAVLKALEALPSAPKDALKLINGNWKSDWNSCFGTTIRKTVMKFIHDKLPSTLVAFHDQYYRISDDKVDFIDAFTLDGHERVDAALVFSGPRKKATKKAGAKCEFQFNSLQLVPCDSNTEMSREMLQSEGLGKYLKPVAIKEDATFFEADHVSEDMQVFGGRLAAAGGRDTGCLEAVRVRLFACGCIWPRNEVLELLRELGFAEEAKPCRDFLYRGEGELEERKRLTGAGLQESVTLLAFLAKQPLPVPKGATDEEAPTSPQPLGVSLMGPEAVALLRRKMKGFASVLSGASALQQVMQPLPGAEAGSAADLRQRLEAMATSDASKDAAPPSKVATPALAFPASSEGDEGSDGLNASQQQSLEVARLRRLEDGLVARLERLGSLTPAEEARLKDVRARRADAEAWVA